MHGQVVEDFKAQAHTDGNIIRPPPSHLRRPQHVRVRRGFIPHPDQTRISAPDPNLKEVCMLPICAAFELPLFLSLNIQKATPQVSVIPWSDQTRTVPELHGSRGAVLPAQAPRHSPSEPTSASNFVGCGCARRAFNESRRRLWLWQRLASAALERANGHARHTIDDWRRIPAQHELARRRGECEATSRLT